MALKVKALLALLMTLVAMISTLQARQVKKECQYEMVVYTGYSRGPSTRKLWVKLQGNGDQKISTTNLIKNWGAMGPNHTYFLPNAEDKFITGKLPCYEYSFCNIRIGGKKGSFKPQWHINNITVDRTDNRSGVYSIVFEFINGHDFTSVNPPIDYGVCLG